MQAVTTIGLDITKSVFQIHGVDDPKRASPRSRSELLAPLIAELRRCIAGDVGLAPKSGAEADIS